MAFGNYEVAYGCEGESCLWFCIYLTRGVHGDLWVV